MIAGTMSEERDDGTVGATYRAFQPRTTPPGGARIPEQPNFSFGAYPTDDISIYPQFGKVCSLLDKLVSSRFPNAVSPIISAHAHAAIPLELGAKVLQQLARALMRRI